MAVKRLRFYSARCTGCRLCEAICTLRHTGSSSREPALLRIVTHEKPMLHRALFCRQCARPACAELCPVEAIYRDEATATVRVDADKCFGCGECIGCPLGSMLLDKTSGQAVLCDLCGGEPACVRFCPFGALEFAEASRQALVAATPIHRVLSHQESAYPNSTSIDELFTAQESRR